VLILAAALIVAGVALFVAAPLGIGLSGARAKSAGREREEAERHTADAGDPPAFPGAAPHRSDTDPRLAP
jgi:hypothetical protein